MERRGSGKAGGVGGLARKVTPDDDIIDTASIPYVSTRLGRGKAGGLLAPEANGLMKKSIDNLAAGFLGSVPTKSFFNNIKSSSSNYLPSSNSVQSNHDEVNGGSIEDISLVIPDVSAKLQLKRNSMFVFTRNRMNSLSVVPENGASSGLRKSINNLAANLSSLVSAKSAARSVQQLQQQQQQIQQQKSDIEMPAAPVGTMTSGGGGAGRASRLSRETSKSSVTSLGSALQISIQRRTSTLPGFRSINHPTGGGGPIGYDPRDVENLEFLKLERKRVLTEAANSVAVDSIYIEPLLIPLAEVHFQLGVFVRVNGFQSPPPPRRHLSFSQRFNLSSSYLI